MSAQPHLIHITGQSHDVIVDLVYAGDSNFTGQVIYAHPLCFLHPHAEACLRKAVAAARGLGFRLKIFDAFTRRRRRKRCGPLRPTQTTSPIRKSAQTTRAALPLT